MPASDLRRTLGVLRGTSVLLTIVIGAGLLTLPGLAVGAAGDHALVAWLACAVLALPLLAIFILLGRRHPEAGGIAAYADRAFGRTGREIAGILFLGAVAFGLPSIALVGGHYAASVLDGSPHLWAALLIAGALVPHLIPGDGAARAMSVVASAVLGVILLFLAAGFLGTEPSPAGFAPLPADLEIARLVAPMMMIFFAFTGWEVGAGIAEEFRDPRRDYTLAMVASFTIAVALYAAIAWLAQTRDLAGLHEAPFVAILRPMLGEAGAIAVAATAVLIVLANLSGAVWGVSRMVFGLAREGTLPAALAATRGGRPLVAVAVTVATLLAVLAADAIGAFGLGSMLALAGQNFVVLFAVAAACLVVIADRLLERILGATAVVVVCALLALQGVALAYPAALALLAVAAAMLRGRRRRRGA
ncbi:APC family permease [Salinarimonas chemoclinalis]|uniref:APC family permease n=1 Tax=Salinarimonas chemoclinalis TaxID=3241599 RepID=UPI00355642B7